MNRVVSRNPGEGIFSTLILIGSVFLFWQAFKIPDAGALSSPASLPIAASAVMVISASIVVIRTWRLPIDPEMRFKYHIFPPVVGIVIALLLLFGIALEPIGFILSAAGFLFIGFMLLHRGSMWVNIGLMFACLALVYLIFRLIFQVVLPEGIIPEREWMAWLSNVFSSDR